MNAERLDSSCSRVRGKLGLHQLDLEVWKRFCMLCLCTGVGPPADGGILRNPVKLCRNLPSNVTAQRGFSSLWTRSKINQFVIHKDLLLSFEGISFKRRLYDRNIMHDPDMKRTYFYTCVNEEKKIKKSVKALETPRKFLWEKREQDWSCSWVNATLN